MFPALPCPSDNRAAGCQGCSRKFIIKKLYYSLVSVSVGNVYECVCVLDCAANPYFMYLWYKGDFRDIPFLQSICTKKKKQDKRFDFHVMKSKNVFHKMLLSSQKKGHQNLKEALIRNDFLHANVQYHAKPKKWKKIFYGICEIPRYSNFKVEKQPKTCKKVDRQQSMFYSQLNSLMKVMLA